MKKSSVKNSVPSPSPASVSISSRDLSTLLNYACPTLLDNIEFEKTQADSEIKDFRIASYSQSLDCITTLMVALSASDFDITF